MVTKHRIGTILLALYLIMAGLVMVIGLHFMYSAVIEGALALLAGIFILAGR